MTRAYRKRGAPLTQEWLLSMVKKARNGCWVWQGACNPAGYGQVGIGGRKDNKRVSVHRVAYELFVGEIPEGMQLLHKCDNSPCANPDHLFLGTQSDNLFDMSNKGRHVGNKKLTSKDIKAIRADPRTQEAIGANYGVGQSNISYIKQRKTWRNV